MSFATPFSKGNKKFYKNYRVLKFWKFLLQRVISSLYIVIMIVFPFTEEKGSLILI